MPKKKPIVSAKKAKVLVVGEAGMRAPIIEHVERRKLGSWPARNPKKAMNSFKHGLKVAMVVIVMNTIEEGCAFAAWIDKYHPHATVVFSSSDLKEVGSKARAAGAEYVIPHAMLARELPKILAYHLEEPAR